MPLPIFQRAQLAIVFPFCVSNQRGEFVDAKEDRLTSARRTDQEHANLFGGLGRAAELSLLQGLDALLESRELAVKAVDFILDYTHGDKYRAVSKPDRGSVTGGE